MNIRRGLIRTWIVLSVIYIVVQGNNSPPPGVDLTDWWTLMWLFVAPPSLWQSF